MAKRLVVLIVMLVVLLATAVPAAFAQGAPIITATGVLGQPSTQGQDPTPIYPLTDEATGTAYKLFDVGAGLQPFVGQRVTIEGTRAPGIDPLALDVTKVGPASGPSPGPSPDRTATLSFELTVKGDPPADTTFLGFIPAEGGISAPLTDPDGDGVFTGSVDVPKFPPGPAPPGTEPVSLPVQIVQNTGGNIKVIKDFGLVKIDGDKTFRARVNFKANGGGTTTPEGTTPESTTPSTGTGGSSNADNSGNGSKGDKASAGPGGIKVLPNTGGAALTTLGAGILLIGGGLLIRKVFR